MLKIFISTFLLVTTPITLPAWEANGHMVVANVAYKYIDKDVMSNLENILQHADDHSPTTSSFVMASVWPDIIKKNGNIIYNNWHYQDTFYSTDDTSLPKIQSDGQAMVMLKKLKKVLVSSSTTMKEKAFALKMYIHIFGDMHQPLHNATLVNKNFPNGNKRGKLWTLKGEFTDLHSFWDFGLGSLERNLALPLNSASIKWLDTYTDNLLADYPQSSFSKEELTASNKNWHKTNIKLVKNQIYKKIHINTLPSTEYLEDNKSTLRKQLALGGLRLANKLNCMFGSDECINKPK